jgi:hypothetical protein
MQSPEINFPVYRKYKNNKSFFKILGPGLFEEIQFVGTKKFVKRVEARLYPEKMFVQDLIHDFGERALEISENEYNRNLP